MIRLTILVMMISVSAFMAGAETSYSTKLLKRISEAMELKIPEHLKPDMTVDSVATFKDKTVRLRTNSFGDVSHIGYRLFDEALVENFSPSVVLDFIERYALELDALRGKIDLAETTSRRNIEFRSGSASLFRNITPLASVSIRHEERKRFEVDITDKNVNISMILPSDYQILSGANAIELEDIMVRNLLRSPNQLIPNTLPKEWEDAKNSYSGNFIIASYGNYLSDKIRSDIYLLKKDGIKALIIDSVRPTQSVKNILLTGCFDNIIPLELTVDKYGNSKEYISISLQQMIACFRSEGCKLYLGIKDSSNEFVDATLFAVNHLLAYNHMVSIKFPVSIIKGGNDTVKGVLYAYTPLQNITDKFFNY